MQLPLAYAYSQPMSQIQQTTASSYTLYTCRQLQIVFVCAPVHSCQGSDLKQPITKKYTIAYTYIGCPLLDYFQDGS